MPVFNVKDLSPNERARIVKCAVSPRPIAWISSQNEHGVDNLAPFSFYNAVSAKEPTVLFVASKNPQDELKDTVKNILNTGEFAVNVVTESLIEAMDMTSKPIPANRSEFDFANIDRAECQQISVPRVAGSVITMECTFYKSIDIFGDLIIIGKICHIHVSDKLIINGKINMKNLNTVGRLGGPYYSIADPLPFERQY